MQAKRRPAETETGNGSRAGEKTKETNKNDKRRNGRKDARRPGKNE